jgi:isopentenyldiphosphate isomerase
MNSPCDRCIRLRRADKCSDRDPSLPSIPASAARRRKTQAVATAELGLSMGQTPVDNIVTPVHYTAYSPSAYASSTTLPSTSTSLVIGVASTPLQLAYGNNIGTNEVVPTSRKRQRQTLDDWSLEVMTEEEIEDDDEKALLDAVVTPYTVPQYDEIRVTRTALLGLVYPSSPISLLSSFSPNARGHLFHFNVE